MDTGDAIRSFIRHDLFADPNDPLELDSPLLDGLLDSGDLMRLVVFLEETFRLEVSDADLSVENFGSVRALERYVASHSATV